MLHSWRSPTRSPPRGSDDSLCWLCDRRPPRWDLYNSMPGMSAPSAATRRHWQYTAAIARAATRLRLYETACPQPHRALCARFKRLALPTQPRGPQSACLQTHAWILRVGPGMNRRRLQVLTIRSTLLCIGRYDPETTGVRLTYTTIGS
jgi:hypothetical protein